MRKIIQSDFAELKSMVDHGGAGEQSVFLQELELEISTTQGLAFFVAALFVFSPVDAIDPSKEMINILY